MRAEVSARGRGVELSIQHHQRAQRLTHPLERVDGRLGSTSRDQALDETTAKIRRIATTGRGGGSERGKEVMLCSRITPT